MKQRICVCACLSFLNIQLLKKDKIVQDVKLYNQKIKYLRSIGIIKVLWEEPIVSFNILNLTFPLNFPTKTDSSPFWIKICAVSKFIVILGETGC